MTRSMRWLTFLGLGLGFSLGSGALMSAQPVLRLKVPIDSSPIHRLPRLPLLTRTHVIVQFDQPPSAATLAALTARGALVLQYLPDNGLLVSVNGRVRLDDLGILSVALMDARSKISPLLSGGTGPLGSNYYLVELYPDVDPSVARRLILNMGLELRENPDLLRQHLLVYAGNTSNASAALQFLATQDPIAYIFPASADLVAGLSVVVCGGALTTLGAIGQIIATNGDGWDGPGLNAATLGYVFQSVTAQLPSGVPQSEIIRAMGEWAKVIQLTWQPGTDSLANRTVNILFATGEHGDGFPFDGPGGVVAHTFYPFPVNAEPIAGDMHFDDAESWHVGTNDDVFSVALHELGHALGLGHSDNPNDVMYPYLKVVTGLADGDKAAILSLYAARTGTTPTGPLVLTIDPPPSSTSAATISLTGTVTGGAGGAVVTWSANSGGGTASLTGTGWVASNIPLAMGLNSITVTATDATGSVSSTVMVTCLAITPLVLTVNPPPATTSSASISLTGTVGGGSGGIAITWVASTAASDGGAINGTSWTITGIPLAIGLNSITVTAADPTESVSVTVNVTRLVGAPLVLTVNPPPPTTTSASISLTGTVTGGAGGAVVTWISSTGASDGATISGTSWSILSVPLAIGLNSITVTASDSAGHVSVMVNVTRVVGTGPTPLTLTVDPPPATTTSASISLTGIVSGGSGGIAITWVASTAASDGGTISGTGWTITGIPLAIGLNSITVTAADPTESVSVTVNVTRTATVPTGPDTTGPTLIITFPSSTSVATTLAALTFTGTASDRSGVASVTWSTNTGGAGTASGTTQWTALSPLLVGSNQVIVTATDTFGNVSWRSVVVTRR